MHGPINVKSPNNISKWHMGINSAFKGLKYSRISLSHTSSRNKGRTDGKDYFNRCSA
jgi:hypothetical protein